MHGQYVRLYRSDNILHLRILLQMRLILRHRGNRGTTLRKFGGVDKEREETYDVTFQTTFIARFSLGFHSAVAGDMALKTT